MANVHMPDSMGDGHKSNSSESHAGHNMPATESGHEGHDEHADHGSHHAKMAIDFRNRFWVSIVLSVPVLLLAPVVQDLLGIEDSLDFTGSQYVQLVLASVSYFYGGWPFLKGLWDEVSSKDPGMMTLVAMAISTAYFYSVAVIAGLDGETFFWELVTLVNVMLLGHWMEMRAVLGASSALESLARLMPAEATLIDEDGETREIDASEIEPGSRLLVRPGERVPADGKIVEGRSSLNESMLTGESKPVEKGENDEVIGGSVNGEASLVIEVSRTGGESYLSQVISLVREAEESRSRSQNLADRSAKLLTITALGVGAVTLITWLSIGSEPSFSIGRTVAVLVIACPHALGLAIPLVVAVSTSIGAKNGFLIRDRDQFERARNIDVIVFDKTGTLTEGRFGVRETVVLEDGTSEDDVLGIAAALERQSEHPIAAGIVRHAEERSVKLERVSDFHAISGRGVKADIGESEVMVVSPGYLSDEGIHLEDERVAKMREEGNTVVFVLKDSKPIGAIALADVVREESAAAVRSLQEMGLKVVMLTGDAEAVAKSVADELGLDAYFAEVLPQDKASKIKELQSEGNRVAMTGDGVNDAPALVTADVGIAVGAGTDVAIDSAGVILVSSNPEDVVSLVKLSRSTYQKMIQNLWWAAGYNLFAIPLAAGVLAWTGFVMAPALGGVFMTASTIIVALNAQLLWRSAKSLKGDSGDSPQQAHGHV